MSPTIIMLLSLSTGSSNGPHDWLDTLESLVLKVLSFNLSTWGVVFNTMQNWCPPRTVLVAPTNAYRDVLAALSITLRTLLPSP